MCTRRVLQILAFISATLVISACAGVPFSTLWHYRNFGPKDFLKTEPSALRVAIQLDDGVSLGRKPPELKAIMQYKGEAEQTFLMPLKVLEQGPWVDAGTGGAEKGKHWYLLALSDEGVKNYRRLQAELAINIDASGHFEKHGQFTIRVSTGKLEYTDAARARLDKTRRQFTQIRLELSSKDGFHTLYKGEVKVSPEMTRKSAGSG